MYIYVYIYIHGWTQETRSESHFEIHFGKVIRNCESYT